MSLVRSESGQATVEFVALLPLVAVVAFALWQAMVAGQAAWLAGSSARAAARARAGGGDPRAAAPAWARRRLSVQVSGRTVRVRVVPPALVPGTGRLLASSSSASAGPR